jgi:8-oxo-dGTP pyrophosphatase MutT (NUDIX family)
MESIAGVLERIERPIAVDPRFTRPVSATEGAGLPRYDRATFPPARPAATLLAIYPGEDGELMIPVTVRRPDLRAHAGEVSLPGGAMDPADTDHQAAALREAHEEIGLDPASVTVLGHLDDIWIPVTNFELRPFVGGVARRPLLRPQASEVTAIVELPLRRLLAPNAVTEEPIEISGWRLQVAVYRYAGHRIWGATARTLAMLAAVLAEVRRDA